MSQQQDDRPLPKSTRRAVLAAAGASSAAGVAAALFASGVAAQPETPEEVSSLTGDESSATNEGATFPQSVASGGPTSSGVILWSRIVPEGTSNDQDESRTQSPVFVDVVKSDEFSQPADFATGRTFQLGDGPSPAEDFTVQVDLDGKLASDTFYRYRFRYRGSSSPIGRCRTLPEAGQEKERLRLAVATCNNFLQGLFPAYGHIADHARADEVDDVDYLVHLGDLIYENAGDGRNDRSIQLPSGHGQAWTLEDFRTLHKTYRSDPDMQEAFRWHTLIHTWDDHEIVNNRWWNYDEDAPETASHPKGDDPEFMRKLYAQGIQALTEYLPLRVEYDPNPDPGETAQDTFQLYRSFQFGTLAELFMTDERLYRTPPPEDEFGRRDFATPPSRAQDDPDRWMLGTTQRTWLIDGVTGSEATWKLWGNEVLNAALKIANAGEEAVYINYDAWDGYEHERRTIMGAFHGRNVENLVVLTGDMHTYIASYLKLDYKDATQSEHVTDEGRVGVELMTPAISSNNLVDSGLFPPAREEQTFDQGTQSQNPHIEWINSSNYGYTVVEFTPDRCTYTAFAIDRDDPDADKRILRVFEVPEGEVELRETRGDEVPEADASDVRDATGADTNSELGPAADTPSDGDEGTEALTDEAGQFHGDHLS